MAKCKVILFCIFFAGILLSMVAYFSGVLGSASTDKVIERCMNCKCKGNEEVRFIMDDYHLYFIKIHPNNSILTNFLWLNESANPKVVELDSREIIGPKIEKKLLSIFNLFNKNISEVAIFKSGSIESLYDCGWNISPMSAKFNAFAGRIRVLDTGNEMVAFAFVLVGGQSMKA
ncbi:Hypothetical predicted protein [Cloeon dipterum]|uniref:Uncharacterized protein n=1 Tax=Cloeon dipterum TaxID=197152 RepID=A0A8S1EDE0_9INSE|nr:Hypothetical predicted protein [Cloeon dipterum]